MEIEPQFRLRRLLFSAAAVAATLAFAQLAVLASRDAPPEFDLAIRDAVHSCARPWLTPLMRGATEAGGGWFLWPAGAALAAFLARSGRKPHAVRLAFTVVGANVVNESLKLFFHRARPEPWFGYPLPSTFSFPSGHSFVSFSFYLCAAALIVQPRWTLPVKAAAYGAALAATLAVGISRVYLGVHYPSDVVGGYAAGVMWLVAIHALSGWWARCRASAR